MQSSGISSPAATSDTSPSPAGPTPSHFALTGRSARVDSRIDAARKDLADIRLAGRIFAPHYAKAIVCSANADSPILAKPGEGEPLSEMLAGERFDVLELSRGLAWGVSPVDGVVGYIDADALGGSDAAPSQPPRGSNDPAANADSLLGTPRKAGGRSPKGVDNSGLIFLSLQMAGIAAPRFCDLQARELGQELAPGASRQRGDLIFWDGHCAIMADGEHVIHVGSEAVVREPLDGITGFGEILAMRRFA